MPLNEINSGERYCSPKVKIIVSFANYKFPNPDIGNLAKIVCPLNECIYIAYQHFHRFPQFKHNTNTVIGSSADLVCFCVLYNGNVIMKNANEILNKLATHDASSKDLTRLH